MTAIFEQARGAALPMRGEYHRRLIFAGSVAALALIGVLSFAGAITPSVFSVVSTTKWALLVAVPVAGLFLLCTQRPTTYCACALVAGAPLSSLGFTAPWGRVLFGTALAAATCPIAFFSSRSRPVRSSARHEGRVNATSESGLAPAAVLSLALLLPSTLLGTHLAERITQLALVAVLCYLVGRASALDPRAVEFVATTFVLTAAVEAILAVFQFQTGHSFNAYGGGTSVFGSQYFFDYGGKARPTGTYFDPNSLGNVLALAAPVAFACIGGLRSVYGKLLHAVALVIIAAGVTVSFSRMSWIAAAAGILIVVALSPRGTRSRQIVGIAGGVIVAGSSILAIAGPSLRVRFSSIFDPTATSVVTANGDRLRERLWSAAASTFSHHPIFGIGFDNLQPRLANIVNGAGILSHAHSTYLQYLSEAGILGGLALTLLGTRIASDVWRLRGSQDRRWISAAAGGSLAALAVCWTTDYSARYTPVLLMMAIPALLARAGLRSASSER